MRMRTIAQLAVAGLVLVTVGTGAPAQSADEAGVVHFAAFGDFAANTDTDAALAGMRAQQPDLALAVGDLSYQATGTEQAWCDMVTKQVGNGFPFELLSGNHESNGQNGNINDFSACLPNQLPGLVGTYGRQWYVDVPRVNPLVRFVMISPNLPFPDSTWNYTAGSAHYNWTAAAIDGARSADIPWVVVGMHKPCLSLGEYGCDVGTDLMQLLMTKHVDLVLTGHEHLYQRTHQLGLGTGCTAITPGTYNANCVADADNDMNQGSGPVFATVGTGGQGLRPVNTADSEYPYFGASSAASHGFLDVRVTADDLKATFMPTDGAFTDAFTIHHGTPPPNTAPTAAFSTTTSGLTATFDARGSTDTEGPIASYAWDFGDGTTGTGAQPQHPYSRADTYTAVLTVTDAGGRTGTVSHPVTVTAPDPSTAFVNDTFSRTVTNGLGTADVGGPWSVSGTPGNFAVSGGTGAITLPAAGQTRSAWLGSTSRTDTDLRLTLSLDRLSAGGPTYLSVLGRRVSTNNQYGGAVNVYTNGQVNASLFALRGSTSATPVQSAVVVPGLTYTAGTRIAVRLQVTGTNPTTIRMKVWPATAAEPTTWLRSATDSGAGLQVAGAVGLEVYLSSAATNAPLVVRMSDVSARPVA